MSDENVKTIDPEAVYYAALGLLDELSSEDQCKVVTNWVKYICVRRAIELAPDEHVSLYPAFEFLCNDFAKIVQELPKRFESDLGGKPCGKCIRCLVDGMLAQSVPEKTVLQ